MRSFQQHLPQFDQKGIRVVAISVDPPEVSRAHRDKLGFTFPILADTRGEVLKRYDLLHQKGGPNGTDVARPAELLVDSTGTVRWRKLTENATVRARPEEVLQASEQM